MTNLYSSDRVDKIARIMPSFTDVAQTGDQVHLGLVGDPMFPEEYKNQRPMATISNIEQTESGAVVTLSHADGSTQVINPGSLSPNQVWEFTDDAFKNVLEREQKAAMRAETPIHDVSESPDYRGVNDLRDEITQLRAELEQERILRMNFNNTYIETLNELSQDIIGISRGEEVQFSNLLHNEYDKMRGEMSLYRGAESPAASEVSDYDLASDMEDDVFSDASFEGDVTEFY